VDIVVRGHHSEVPERFRQHVQDKLAKIEKLDPRVISVDVVVSKERNPRLADECERVEITVISPGPVIRAEAGAQDCYAALDASYERLENRLRRVNDRRKVHHGSKSPQSVRTATAGLRVDEPAAVNPNGAAPVRAAPGTAEPVAPAEGAAAAAAPPASTPASPAEPATREPDGTAQDAGPMVIREKTHPAKPINIDQALYEMELVGHDFYLFIDVDTSQPCVVYRRRGYDYGVIRLAV
jgi:ribosomal subunit interface protein